jgi:UDP-galactopyranose mutase
MQPSYDYLIVGAGLFGSIFAREATDRGKRVLVIDKRNHIAGNCHTEVVEGIPVHKYGPHIFHTSQPYVWEYVNRFADFNHFSLRTRAHYQGRLYSLPINLSTIHQVWPDILTPSQAEAKLAAETAPFASLKPANLEEHALSQVGPTLYEMFIRGYTAKQWGRDPKELPASIIKRLPVRLTMNDRYFHDSHRFEGIPIGGYTAMIARILDGIEVRLNADYLLDRAAWDALSAKTVYTGPIDALYDHCYGHLEYRSLRFEEERWEGDFQGNAIINYTEESVPFTRIVEHKHFEFLQTPHTIITREYPALFQETKEPFYPVNDDANNALYARYRDLAERESRLIIGGRLGNYRYYDMDMTVANALSMAKAELDRAG